MDPISVEELEELVRTRPCRGSAPPSRYSDILARFPRMRGEILAWFESALADDTRKWVAAALLRGRREAVPPLIGPLLLAAIREPDPSFNRAFVSPLVGVLGYDEACALLLEIATTRNDPGGAARAEYWLNELGPGSKTCRRRFNSWRMHALSEERDVYARRSLVTGISFERELLDDEAAAVAHVLVDRLRSDPDPYIRERLAVQLGESKVFPALLPPPKRDT